MNTSTSAHGTDGRLGQEPGPFQFGGGLVQPHRRRDDLVVPGFRGAGDERVGPPSGDDVAPVGGADRAGQPNAVDEQRLAHLGRPGGAGVVGDHRQHDFAAAPAAFPAGTERHRPNTGQAERRQHMSGGRSTVTESA